MSCQYSDILGKVGEGAHSFRIFNIAIVDVLLTVLLAYVIKLFMPSTSFILILVVLFLVGIAVHRIFCVKTTVDKLIFGD